MKVDFTKNEEYWKEIPRFEGLYEASSLGKIRTKNRTIFWSRYGKSCKSSIKSKEVASFPDARTGHLRVSLRKKGHQKTYYVHYLVLITFVGPRPEGKVCRHYPDRNPSNNRVENLRWGTTQENSEDMVAHGTSTKGRHFNQGENHGNSRFVESEVRKIRDLYFSGNYTIDQIAKLEKASFTAIRCIIRRVTWKHI